MKIMILAGEESGLIYAKRLAEILTEHEIRGYADYGFKTADLAVMGFFAVLKRLFYFLRVKRTMERAIDEWNPDVVCTIDYPGMNLPLSRHAKKHGIRTVHVVCPQVWAWRSGRIPKIEASTDCLCCFFPFEPPLFKPGFAVFTGHPLVEEFKSTESAVDEQTKDKNIKIALLPGSRMGEIASNLPIMLNAAKRILREKSVRFSIPAAHKAAFDEIAKIVAEEDADEIVSVRMGGARELLRSSHCAVVASGTATLESALSRCPTVIVYRVNAILAWILRRVIKGVRHIGLANIIWEKTGEVGEEPMPELLQEDFTEENIVDRVMPLITDDSAHQKSVQNIDRIVSAIGTGDSPMEKIANIVLGKYKEQTNALET